MVYRCAICGESGVTDQTIIDEWNTIPTPPAPELKSVAVDPKTSALLVLDMETSICKNTRCIASISKINKLLTKTREMGMLVVYSLTDMGNPSDIAWQIAPLTIDPMHVRCQSLCRTVHGLAYT